MTASEAVSSFSGHSSSILSTAAEVTSAPGAAAAASEARQQAKRKKKQKRRSSASAAEASEAAKQQVAADIAESAVAAAAAATAAEAAGAGQKPKQGRSRGRRHTAVAPATWEGSWGVGLLLAVLVLLFTGGAFLCVRWVADMVSVCIILIVFAEGWKLHVQRLSSMQIVVLQSEHSQISGSWKAVDRRVLLLSACC
jgi:hypothetical protein